MLVLDPHCFSLVLSCRGRGHAERDEGEGCAAEGRHDHSALTRDEHRRHERRCQYCPTPPGDHLLPGPG